MNGVKIASHLLVTVLGLNVALAACSKSDRSKTEEGRQAIEKANELTERGVNHKQVGRNGDALSLFKQARAILEPALGRVSVPVASSIDDIATINMRTGDYKNARKNYLAAIKILGECDPTDKRLLSSTVRRLATLEALESQNIVCDEPMVPEDSETTDSGVPKVPYFPSTDEVLKAFGKINPRLSDCVKGPKQAVTTWMVLSGKGIIIRAEVRSKMRGTEAAECIEKRAVALSHEMKELFPPFKACFKNFNYPFLLGD